MRFTRSVALLAAASLYLGGCHCTFKKYVGTIGSARVQVVTTGGPDVQLGKVYNYDSNAAALISTVINTVQMVKEIDQTTRIANAVQIQEVNGAMQDGFAQALQAGPPFAYTTDNPAPAVVQIEVLRYGLYVPFLGAPGTFDYEFRTRIYRADGKRVYSYRSTCSTGAGNPDAISQVLGVVNNVAQIKDMTDSEINQSFLATASWCGSYLVTKMRKHAG